MRALLDIMFGSAAAQAGTINVDNAGTPTDLACTLAQAIYAANDANGAPMPPQSRGRTMSNRDGGPKCSPAGVFLALLSLAAVVSNDSAASETVARSPMLANTAVRAVAAPTRAHSVTGGIVGHTLWAVNSTADTTDGVCDVTNCTLREAMYVALPGDAIAFSSLFNMQQTISIGSALPDISFDLTIIGPGANLLTVRANDGGNYTILTINSGFVSLSGLTLTNGNADFAGGINNLGTLSLTDSVITGNHANVNGGGIQNGGSLVVTGSTISGNTAGAEGGGLFNFTNGWFAATASLSNTTISGNSATNGFGAVSSVNFGGTGATVTLTNCTVAGNTGGSGAVAAYNAGGGATINLKNTIIANNTVPGLSAIGASTQVVSLGNNLATDNGSSFLTGSGDLVNTNPLLTTFGNYGGPTWTYYPKPGSLAIDAGNDSGAPATDQRGVSRPQGAHLDIGAVEADGTLIFQDGFDGP